MDPRELLLRELAEMLDVEETLAVQVLPKLRRGGTEKHFQEALDEHLDQTRSHAEQFEEGVRTVGEPALLDLFCASSAAHTEHFEISAYHSLITLANILGEPEVVRLLEQNLHEEEDALEKVEKAIPERLSGQLAPA